MNTELFEPPVVLTKADLDFQRKIGEGAYASVWRVKDKTTGKLFALKMVQKAKVEKILPQFRREVSIMYEVEHPHIAKLYTHFEDFKCFYLLMDLCEGGTLFNKLCREKHFSEKVACEYFRQIVSAVEYLHKRDPPIIHRDIKPENVLLTRKNRVKVTDFGWANYLSSTRFTTCGTLEYLPPEIIEEKAHDLSVDIWCLGVLLYEMLCGATPFKASVKEMLIFNITKGSVRFPKGLSVQAQDLILKMLDRTQETRLTIDHVKSHEWIKGYSDVPTPLNPSDEDFLQAKSGENESPKKKQYKVLVNTVESPQELRQDTGKKQKSVDRHEEEVTAVTNFTEVCSATKESIKSEDIFSKEDLETCNDTCYHLQARISSLQNERIKLQAAEKALQKSLYDSELELMQLQSGDSMSILLEKIHNTQKSVFDKVQQCKRQGFYLEQLKTKVSEKTQDLESKETQLKQLSDSMKSLNQGMSRIKTYKSLDISTLQIDLDVINHQLIEKMNRQSNPPDFNFKEAMGIISNNVQGFKYWSKREYEKKIEAYKEKSADLEQKIAELTIGFELSKGKVLQEFRKNKDILIKIGKQNREDLFLKRILFYERERAELEGKLRNSRVEENFGVCAEVLEGVRTRRIVRDK